MGSGRFVNDARSAACVKYGRFSGGGHGSAPISSPPVPEAAAGEKVNAAQEQIKVGTWGIRPACPHPWLHAIAIMLLTHIRNNIIVQGTRRRIWDLRHILSFGCLD